MKQTSLRVMILAGSFFVILPQLSADEAALPEYSDQSSGAEVDRALQVAQTEVQDPFQVKFELPDSEAPDGGAVPPGNAGVSLQGIGLGEKKAYAVINGEVYSTGEEKKGIKMIEARKREVDILVDGEFRTVPLPFSEGVPKEQGRFAKK